MMHGHGGGSDDAGQLESKFQLAVALRREGDLSRAAALCAAILDIEPRHFNAHHLHGLLAFDRGEMAAGVASLCRSLTLNPHQALAYSNLGNALLSMGQPARALASLDEALRLNPKLAVAHYNRGNALKEMGRFEEALASYDASLSLSGGDVRALNNKGLVLRDLGRLAEALAAFSAATALDPSFTASSVNLSAVLLKLDRAQEALAVSERAFERDPGDTDALCARAEARLALGRLEAACEDFERLLQSKPDSTTFLGNAGNLLLALDRADAAFCCFDRVLAQVPDDPAALYGRGAALLKLERLEEGVRSFHEVLRIDPEHGSTLGSLFHLRMSRCDWQDYERLASGLHDSLRRTLRFVNPLSLLSFDDPETSLACARAFVAKSMPPVASPTGPLRPGPGKIRLAYVSADFCDHPVARCLVGVLEHHDRRRFEVIGVSLRPRGEGAFERRVRSTFDVDIDASALGDGDAAEAMREAGVDIAVDLMGFTEGSRLGIFAHRPAAVQVSYLGYAGTLGAPYIDFLMADEVVIPAGMESFYAERVVRLPYCYLPTDDRRPVGIVPSRAAAGLPPRGFVFCAFTKAHKITPEVFGVWMRLLRAAPHSVLWLSDMGLPARENLERTAERAGVSKDRLLFAPRVADNAAHLARLALADLYLDTQPYNAHSTAGDALWVGVPVLTCAGRALASRVASSVLLAAGLPELVTGNLAEYERLAMELVGQPGKLCALRERLIRGETPLPLFATARYTRDLESAYRSMHERAR